MSRKYISLKSSGIFRLEVVVLMAFGRLPIILQCLLAVEGWCFFRSPIYVLSRGVSWNWPKIQDAWVKSLRILANVTVCHVVLYDRGKGFLRNMLIATPSCQQFVKRWLSLMHGLRGALAAMANDDKCAHFPLQPWSSHQHPPTHLSKIYRHNAKCLAHERQRISHRILEWKQKQ
jgi:hypothetical protein